MEKVMNWAIMIAGALTLGLVVNINAMLISSGIDADKKNNISNVQLQVVTTMVKSQNTFLLINYQRNIRLACVLTNVKCSFQGFKQQLWSGLFDRIAGKSDDLLVTANIQIPLKNTNFSTFFPQSFYAANSFIERLIDILDDTEKSPNEIIFISQLRNTNEVLKLILTDEITKPMLYHVFVDEYAKRNMKPWIDMLCEMDTKEKRNNFLLLFNCNDFDKENNYKTNIDYVCNQFDLDNTMILKLINNCGNRMRNILFFSYSQFHNFLQTLTVMSNTHGRLEYMFDIIRRTDDLNALMSLFDVNAKDEKRYFNRMLLMMDYLQQNFYEIIPAFIKRFGNVDYLKKVLLNETISLKKDKSYKIFGIMWKLVYEFDTPLYCPIITMMPAIASMPESETINALCNLCEILRLMECMKEDGNYTSVRLPENLIKIIDDYNQPSINTNIIWDYFARLLTSDFFIKNIEIFLSDVNKNKNSIVVCEHLLQILMEKLSNTEDVEQSLCDAKKYTEDFVTYHEEIFVLCDNQSMKNIGDIVDLFAKNTAVKNGFIELLQWWKDMKNGKFQEQWKNMKNDVFLCGLSGAATAKKVNLLDALINALPVNLFVILKSMCDDLDLQNLFFDQMVEFNKRKTTTDKMMFVKNDFFVIWEDAMLKY